MYSIHKASTPKVLGFILFMFILIPGGYADFDADGVDLTERYPYGYCPFAVAAGDYIYSANGTVMEVLDIHTLVPVGEVLTESIVSSLAISGNFVYIANWSDGFKVIDISDPTDPTLIAQIDFEGQCWDLSVSGDYAFLGNNTEGLQIIDISNPSLPSLASTFLPQETAAFEYTQVIDTIAYAASQSGLYILNVSDPAAPVQLGYSPAENGAWSVNVVDTIAYLPKMYDGIRMVNVADPTNPIELGYFQTPDGAKWVEVVDTIAYVAEGYAGIQILDISDLTAPDSIGMFEVDYADASNIQGDSMVVASSSWGLKLVDISDCPNLVLLNENPGGGYARDIYATDTISYVAMGGLGMGVFTHSETGDPEMIALLEMDNLRGLNGSGDFLYVIEDTNIHIIDISDPANPQIVSTWFEGSALTSTVVGHLLFVGGDPDIQILDISDPSNPLLVGILDGLPWVTFDIKVNGRFAYVVNRGGGFWVIDIGDPTSPETVGGLEIFDYAWRLDIAGELVYIADRYTGQVRIIDVSDPTMPFETSGISIGSLVNDIACSGRYVYGLDAWEGVRIIDSGDPYNPVEVGYFNTGGYAQAVHEDKGRLAVADGGGGLYFMETEFTDSNLGSANFWPGDRIRVTDINPIHPQADPSAYAITGHTITVEAWVFPTQLPGEGTSVPIILRPYWNLEPLRSYELMINNMDGSGTAKYAFAVSDGNIPVNDAMAISGSPTVLGEWIHIAGTYDGTTVRLYENGELTSETAFNGELGNGDTGFYLGRITGDMFSGLIDEVRLWDTARSQAELQLTMHVPLAGNEGGLRGCWPLDASYTLEGIRFVQDITPYHNDLQFQGGGQIEGFPAGSEVLLAPVYQYFSLSTFVGDQLEFPIAASYGWPLPSATLLDGPAGMSIDPVTNLLSWSPVESQRGWHEFTYEFSNAAGTASGPANVWGDAVPLETVTQDISNVELTFANNGTMGYYGHFNENRGFTFEGINGLYAANLILGVSDNQVSGGLYVEEFGMLSGIELVESSLDGFDQAYETSFDDFRAPLPLGVQVLQRTHSKSSSPDEDYIIVEYEISNTSGNTLSDLHVGFSADWDVGEATNNLCGYDEERSLSYVYEVDGANNVYYYASCLIGEPVSGHSATGGGGYDDAESYAELTGFTDLPTEAQDIRTTLGCGPFSLLNDETVVVRFALLGGEDLTDLMANADQANSLNFVSTDGGGKLPLVYALHPNYPNPFNPTTTISYSLPEQSNVRMTVFDIQGREVMMLQDGVKSPGNYRVQWNGMDKSGSPVSTGVYFCRLQAGTYSQTIKMVYLR